MILPIITLPCHRCKYRNRLLAGKRPDAKPRFQQKSLEVQRNVVIEEFKQRYLTSLMGMYGLKLKADGL